jgi:spore coat polysaccharide biosynthesis protein SpsF
VNHAVIIQARLNSTRLTGKVLMPLGDTTVLGQVIRRAKAIPGITHVCIAVPDSSADDPVAADAERCGALVYRGPEEDVLCRYHDAAASLKADTVMRITSDCPIFDPALSGAVLQLLLESGVEYASNNMPASWPHGTETEVFTMSLLGACQRRAETQFEREHVTVLMRYRDDVSRINLLGDQPEQRSLRWTVDHPLDYEFMRRLFDFTGPQGPRDMNETLQILARQPELSAINAHFGHYDAEEPAVVSRRIRNWSPLSFQAA